MKRYENRNMLGCNINQFSNSFRNISVKLFLCVTFHFSKMENRVDEKICEGGVSVELSVAQEVSIDDCEKSPTTKVETSMKSSPRILAEKSTGDA